MLRTPLDSFHASLARICRHAVHLLRAEAGAIYLKEGDEFVMRASFGYDKDLVGKARYAPGQGITGWIGLGNMVKADSAEEVREHPSHTGKYNAQLWRRRNFRCWSLLGYPLALGDYVFGIIKVENKREEGRKISFSDDDVHDLEIFVNAIIDGIRANHELLRLLGSLYVFVQIPFSAEFNNVYRIGIKQTAEGLGMRCEKVDEVHLPQNILQQIYDCISRADIVISEMTHRNPNVFYETGYAHALGKRTILLAQTGQDIPFDLLHYKHIIYDPGNLEALQDSLRQMLLATRHELLTAR